MLFIYRLLYIRIMLLLGLITICPTASYAGLLDMLKKGADKFSEAASSEKTQKFLNAGKDATTAAYTSYQQSQKQKKKLLQLERDNQFLMQQLDASQGQMGGMPQMGGIGRGIPQDSRERELLFGLKNDIQGLRREQEEIRGRETHAQLLEHERRIEEYKRRTEELERKIKTLRGHQEEGEGYESGEE